MRALVYCNFHREVRLVSGRQVSVCATILACVILVRALVYCNFHREVGLGGWGSEGPNGPTLGRPVC